MTTLKDQFLLDPSVTYLNHGSFGACPKPVFDVYQQFQRELEWQPVEFLGRQHDAMITGAKEALGKFLNADKDDLVFVPNATLGLNTIIRSLKLEPGDEILTTNHEYGALNNTWAFVCQKTGAKYINYPMPLPVTTHEAFVEDFWKGVTPKTKVIYISHITSPTALIFPVKEICRRAREAGILSIVDGAHVPGQIPLDLTDIDADFYSGNLHKWLCAPKGCAFFHARKDKQDMVEPLVISHGWTDPSFVVKNQWQGTRDISAFLSVPAAIKFFEDNNWDQVRATCHELAREARKQINAMTGVEPVSPDSTEWFSQMVMCPIPADSDVNEIKKRLWDEFKIEIPQIDWNGWKAVRVSFQAYNTSNDLETLLSGLQAVLKL
ncbi:MAG: aminotransferase class V-fold PLP-dependent enzyme [Chloroflexi bacterium]|nr:aminotransferase class V-fold PLP-dependent enzyme [Chloroflexota bacterium]MCC6893776.1 aminotransferase class V-fold PLP-dependent enzyme [Anaerolineae bacterium]